MYQVVPILIDQTAGRLRLDVVLEMSTLRVFRILPPVCVFIFEYYFQDFSFLAMIVEFYSVCFCFRKN